MTPAKIKEHVKKYQIAYVFGGAILAGFTFRIMRGRHAGVLSAPDGQDAVTVRSLFLFSDNNKIVNVLQRDGRGHPGYIVRCLETGDYYPSQAVAATAVGTSAANMSSHLKGKFPDVYGLHFERLAA